MKLRDLAKLVRAGPFNMSGAWSKREAQTITDAAINLLSRPTCGGEVGEPGLLIGLDPNARGGSVDCSVCGKEKGPRGRSAPLEMANSLCDSYDCCAGYMQEPRPSDLWPTETREQFGYPKCTGCAACTRWGNEDG